MFILVKWAQIQMKEHLLVAKITPKLSHDCII